MEQQLQKLTQAILARGELLKQLEVQCAAILASVEEMKPKPVTPPAQASSSTLPAQASSSRSLATDELDNLMPARCSKMCPGDDTASLKSALMPDAAPGSPTTAALLDVAITSPAPSLGAHCVCANTCIVTAHQAFDEMPRKWFDCYQGGVPWMPPWPPPQGHGTVIIAKGAGLVSEKPKSASPNCVGNDLWRQGNMQHEYTGRNCVPLEGVGVRQELISVLRYLRLYMFFSKRPYEVFLEFGGYGQSDILIRKSKARLMKPAFTVVRDECTKCFLIFIRGAITVRDRLAATTAVEVPFHHAVLQEGHVSNLVVGHAHCGMVAAARWIANQAIPCLSRAIKEGSPMKVVSTSLPSDNTKGAVSAVRTNASRGNFRHSTGVLPERKGVNVANLAEISNASSLDRATPERALHTANLCWRVLLSRDNVVIRRFILTVVCIIPCFLGTPLSEQLLSKEHQCAMLASIVHIVNGDWASLVYNLTEMDVVPPRTNLRRVTMDLEDALGEVTFKDGIPDIKFSRVLGKIWSVAFKYHFRMPPYYTLVLRSLASLEGLAIAADGTFKTFQAAYPYVVQKLLSDNSLGTRRILYQVIFNKRKEFQWHKIAVFLKLASARGNFRHSTGVLPERKGVNIANLVEISNASSLDRATPERALHTANLCLKVLLSRDNVVIRRLIMTANAKSLSRDLISKDALIFRALLSRVLGNVVCQWMVKVTGLNRVRQLEPCARMTTGKNEGDLGLSKEASTLMAFHEAVRDRRLKIIFSKFLRDLREEPVLMIRVSWNVFVISVISAAIGMHRFMVFLSEEYLPKLPPPVPPPRLVQIQSL